MANLSGAVSKTMESVFSDLRTTQSDKKRRLQSLKENIGKVVTLSLSEIETNENVRKSIDRESESFLRLVESVKKYGILENIVAELRVDEDGRDYKLVCIAGHRRILAALEAKTITKVPCLLQAYSEKSDRVGAALAENLNREDLHCLDVAEGYRKLVDEGWREDDLVSHFCRESRTVRHYLKMASWSDEVKDLLRSHSAVFSTRVIMRQFAYKKFASNAELKRGIRSYLTKAKNPNHPKMPVAKKPQGEQDKEATRLALTSYLAKQRVLSKAIKDEIRRAFAELKLI